MAVNVTLYNLGESVAENVGGNASADVPAKGALTISMTNSQLESAFGSADILITKSGQSAARKALFGKLLGRAST